MCKINSCEQFVEPPMRPHTHTHKAIMLMRFLFHPLIKSNRIEANEENMHRNSRSKQFSLKNYDDFFTFQSVFICDLMDRYAMKWNSLAAYRHMLLAQKIIILPFRLHIKAIICDLVLAKRHSNESHKKQIMPKGDSFVHSVWLAIVAVGVTFKSQIGSGISVASYNSHFIEIWIFSCYSNNI